jgi:NAD+ synthase (glutamine-hydrolysing)
LIAQGDQFQEDFIVLDLKFVPLRKLRSEDRGFRKRTSSFQSSYHPRFLKLGGRSRGRRRPLKGHRPQKRLTLLEEIYQALVVGTRDYVRKNGFHKVVIGLSGGIDSALTATIAADALGKEDVVGVTMPSQYSSAGSVTDSAALAKNLGIELRQIPIAEPFEVLKSMLKNDFGVLPEDITEENLQARVRGILLMALSNKFKWLVLAPGNKSEMSVGYCTLYGDMVGGFAVIKDVPKTLVYKLALYRNRAAGAKLIPQSIINKEPSAELKPDQRDVDSLPPYRILDPILEAYVENDYSIQEIIDMGYDEKMVKEVTRMVDTNEYKRRQAPPGIKITPRAFGKDRRIPITNWFRD